ncbi:MAG: pyruvate kinase [Cellulosilyticaceae bacterium]
MRKTKIIATLGPKTCDVDSIRELIHAGVNAFRLNFSHGNHDTHIVSINNVKQVREELGMPIPIILDTKGPEIRTGVLKGNDDIKLNVGETFVLTTEEIEGDDKRVSVSYKNLPYDLKRGSRILIDDGLIELKVKNLTNTEVECVIENGGMLGSTKGVNIPDVYVNLPALTDKDKSDIKFGSEQGVDYVAASFVRCANDVIKMRQELELNGGGDIQIISKIESRDGVDNIDEILQVTDAIMVARGDLGVEIPTEEVPIVQKMLINKCNALGKPVVTATQMLDSMIKNPRPTRAEASDVANAIFDGTSVIMLSGETAKGDYPIQTVQMMDRIARKAEATSELYNLSMTNMEAKVSMTNAISHATCSTARDLEAAAIVTITKSGHTARAVSKFKPRCPIVACTPDERVLRQLNLVWGCQPHLIGFDEQTTDDVFASAVAKAEEKGFAKQGDVVVLTAGVPVGVAGTTNILKVQYVGNVLARGIGCGKKSITGKASVIKVLDEADKYFAKGDILIAPKTDNSYLPYMKKASAIIVEDSTAEENNHAAIVGRTLDIPVIIAAKNVAEAVRNATTITVDSEKGLVYNGAVVKK